MRLLETTAIGIAVLIGSVPVLLSQDAKPTFEVASIKPNNSGDPGQYFKMGGVSPSVTNMTLRFMIRWAYDMHDFQLVGGPGWMDTEHYDMQARTSAGASNAQIRLMMQRLLEDRFKLVWHRETKEMPVYNLAIVKGGFKLEPIQEGSCIAFDAKNPPPPGSDPMKSCGMGGTGRGMMMASSATLAEMASTLSNVVDRTVVDKTGISGKFRYRLTFAPLDPATPDAGGPATPTDAPSIFTALQEQFGLRLDSAKGPVEVMVIDHAEKPSEN